MAHEDKNVDELRDELRRRDLPTSGSKGDLVDRLDEHDSAQAGDGPSEGDEERSRLAPDEGGPSSAAEKAQLAPDAADPYPAYDGMDVDALQSLADKRGVFINRDVERAEWIGRLRKAAVDRHDQPAANLDMLTLDTLRAMAGDLDVTLTEEFVRSHLITELRAQDSGAT